MGNPVFIERLLMLMTERDINQEQLAAALDLPRQDIADWLYEGTVPANAVLDRLAALFDVTAGYMLGNCGIKQKKIKKEQLWNSIFTATKVVTFRTIIAM